MTTQLRQVGVDNGTENLVSLQCIVCIFALVHAPVGVSSDNEIIFIAGREEGELLYAEGPTPNECTAERSCVWLCLLISPITAQLDWPDVLRSFIKRITHSMKASSRQLLLQQSPSILGAPDSVWRVAVSVWREWENWNGPSCSSFCYAKTFWVRCWI